MHSASSWFQLMRLEDATGRCYWCECDEINRIEANSLYVHVEGADLSDRTWEELERNLRGAWMRNRCQCERSAQCWKISSIRVDSVPYSLIDHHWLMHPLRVSSGSWEITRRNSMEIIQRPSPLVSIDNSVPVFFGVTKIVYWFFCQAISFVPDSKVTLLNW